MSQPTDSTPETSTEAPAEHGREAALAFLEGLPEDPEDDEIHVEVEEPEDDANENAPKNSKPTPKAEPEKETKSWQAYRRKIEALKREKDSLSEARRTHENEKATHAAEVQQAKADAAFLRELRELSKTDQEAVLERLGISYEDVTKSLLLKGSPEEKANRTEAQVRKLREELAAKEQAEEQRQLTARRTNDERLFVDFIKEGDRFPIARKAPPQKLVPLAHQAADLLREAGHQSPTLEQIAKVVADHLEEERKQFIDDDAPPAAALGKAPSKTLSSRDITDGGKTTQRKMTREERLKHAADALRLPDSTPPAVGACIQTGARRGAESPPDPHRAQRRSEKAHGSR